MRARIQRQYRNGKKLTPVQLVNEPRVVGILELSDDRGRQVMRLKLSCGSEKEMQGELFMPVLMAMYGDTFRLVGIEKATSGAWVHQAWFCEVRNLSPHPGLTSATDPKSKGTTDI